MAGGRGWNIRDATRRFQFRVTRHASFPTTSDGPDHRFQKICAYPALVFCNRHLVRILVFFKGQCIFETQKDIYLGGFACFLAHLREGYPGDYAQ